MSEKIYCDPMRRHDFVLLFDVMDGNPNGDPDAGNLPRVDPETMQGLVTDVCLKRKVRNWVAYSRPNDQQRQIYIQNKGRVLNELHAEALAEVEKAGGHPTPEAGRAWMCQHYYDVRMFGAVMSTGEKSEKKSCGQVRGPVQLTFARSIDPIIPLEASITRLAITNAKDRDDANTMGRKAFVPYGLYRGFGFVNPTMGRQTGMEAQDLELFWEALLNCWDMDRSASKGRMACRGLHIFTHDNELGRAPAHMLQDRVQVSRLADVTTARAFEHYQVTVDDHALPDGVNLTSLVS